jgi:hypothetical protein
MVMMCMQAPFASMVLAAQALSNIDGRSSFGEHVEAMTHAVKNGARKGLAALEESKR